MSHCAAKRFLLYYYICSDASAMFNQFVTRAPKLLSKILNQGGKIGTANDQFLCLENVGLVLPEYEK